MDTNKRIDVSIKELFNESATWDVRVRSGGINPIGAVYVFPTPTLMQRLHAKWGFGFQEQTMRDVRVFLDENIRDRVKLYLDEY